MTLVDVQQESRSELGFGHNPVELFTTGGALQSEPLLARQFQRQWRISIHTACRLVTHWFYINRQLPTPMPSEAARM
jgi:hypothetical protein